MVQREILRVIHELQKEMKELKKAGQGLGKFHAGTWWKRGKEEACLQEHEQVLLEPWDVRARGRELQLEETRVSRRLNRWRKERRKYGAVHLTIRDR